VIDAGVAAPFRRKRKCWSSDTVEPSQGSLRSMAGPPVEKLNSVGPSSVPCRGDQPAARFRLQRTPGGSGWRKSMAHSRSFTQRVVRSGAGPLHSRVMGAQRHHRLVEPHHHLTHLRHLALRRDAGDASRLRTGRRQAREHHQPRPGQRPRA
jgi:hypothetical protein